MQYHLAQLNIAKLIAPINDPKIAEFVAKLDEINALAEKSDGFVWRLKEENSDNATGYNPFGDKLIIVNMSVWENIESLKNYVYRSAHSNVMRDRTKWFEKYEGVYFVMWWVPKNHQPTLEEAKEKLLYLSKNGETPNAFTFKQPFEIH